MCGSLMLANRQAPGFALDIASVEGSRVVAERSFAEIGHLVMQQYFQRHEFPTMLEAQEQQQQQHGTKHPQNYGFPWPTRSCQVLGTVEDPSFAALWDGYRSSACELRRPPFVPEFETARGTAAPVENPLLDTGRRWEDGAFFLGKRGNEVGDESSVDTDKSLLPQEAGADVDAHDRIFGTRRLQSNQVQQELEQQERRTGTTQCGESFPIERETIEVPSAAAELKSTQENLDRWGLLEDQDCWEAWTTAADNAENVKRIHYPQIGYLGAEERSSGDERFKIEVPQGKLEPPLEQKGEKSRPREKKQPTVDRKVNKITFDRVALFQEGPSPLNAAFEKLLHTRAGTCAVPTLSDKAEKPTLDTLFNLCRKPLENFPVESVLVHSAMLCPERERTADPWLTVLANEVEDEWEPTKEQRSRANTGSIEPESTAASAIWKSWRCPWLSLKSPPVEYLKTKDSVPFGFPQPNVSKGELNDGLSSFPPMYALDSDADDCALAFYDEGYQIQGNLALPFRDTLSSVGRRFSADSPKAHNNVTVKRQETVHALSFATSNALGDGDTPLSDPNNASVLFTGEGYAEALRGILDTSNTFTQVSADFQATSMPPGTASDVKSNTGKAQVVDSPRMVRRQRGENTHDDPLFLDGRDLTEAFLSCSSSRSSKPVDGDSLRRQSDHVGDTGATTEISSRRTSYACSSIAGEAAQLLQSGPATNNDEAIGAVARCFEHADTMPRKECIDGVNNSRRSSDASSTFADMLSLRSSTSYPRTRAARSSTASTTEKFMDFLLVMIRRAVQAEMQPCRDVRAADTGGHANVQEQQLLEGPVVRLTFKQLVPEDGISSTTAAKAFHHILILHMRGSVVLQQDQPQQKYVHHDTHKRRQHKDIHFPSSVGALSVCVKRHDLL